MRRDVGRHADRDAGRSVDQKIGNAGGKNFGLELALVVIGAEIDGFFVDIFEQRGGNAGKPRFGVPHRRGRIAIDGTEISLAIDQRIAHGEILRHADQGIVDRRVAVRVEFAEDFADDLGALAGGPVGREAHFAHAEKNAAMDGLEAVANVGKGASHDHAHGVIDVRALHLVFDVDVDIAVVIVAATAGWKRYLRRRRWTLRRIALVSHMYYGVSSYFSRKAGVSAQLRRTARLRLRQGRRKAKNEPKRSQCPLPGGWPISGCIICRLARFLGGENWVRW